MATLKTLQSFCPVLARGSNAGILNLSSAYFNSLIVFRVPHVHGSRPTPNPLPSRPLFVAGDLLSSSSFILFLRPSYFLLSAAPPPSESRFNWPLCTRKIVEAISLEHSIQLTRAAAEVARRPRNAGARLRGRTTEAMSEARTTLPESSSQYLPPKRPIHAT